jgi:hypothetical protein
MLDTSPNSIFNQMEKFAVERHSIYLRRASGLPAPWTEDPILQRGKFANIFRELDRTTVWIRKHVREPFADHEHLWFMVVLARFFNRADCLEYLIQKAWPADDRWSAKKLMSSLRLRQANGSKIWNSGAYRISNTYPHEMDTVEYVCNHVFPEIWKDRKRIECFLVKTNSCNDVWSFLRSYPNLGSFTAAQIVYDLMYTRYLIHATDRDTWAGCGTGSIKGLDLVYGRPDGGRLWSSKILQLHGQHLDEVLEIKSKIRWPSKWQVLAAHDIENCLCEFYKYARAKQGGYLPSFVAHV